MGLGTDALDLYLRMAGAFDDTDIRSVFIDLAEEERIHLERLGSLRGRESQKAIEKSCPIIHSQLNTKRPRSSSCGRF